MDFAAVFDEDSPKQRSSRQHRGRRRKTLSPSRVTTFLSEVELHDDPMNFPDPPSLVEAAAAAAARAAEAVMEAMDQFADSNDVAGLLDTPAAKQRYSFESSSAASPLLLAFATPSTIDTAFAVSSSSGQRSSSASARNTPASGATRSVLGVLHSSGGNIVVATPVPLSKAVTVSSTSTSSSSSSSSTKRQTALQENCTATSSTHASPAADSTAEVAAVAQKPSSPQATTAAQTAAISPIALAGTSPGGFFAGDDTAIAAVPQGRSQRGGRRNRRQSFVLPPEAEMLQSVDDAAAAEAASTAAPNTQESPATAAAVSTAAATAAATAEQPLAAAATAVASQPQGPLPTATDGFLVAPALQQGWGSAVELSRNSNNSDISSSSSSDNDLRALTRAFAAAPAGSQRARRAAARVYCLTGYPLAAMAARDAAELCTAAAAAQTHPLSWSPYDSPVHDSSSRLRGAVVSVGGPSKDGKRALVRRLAPVLEAMEQRGSSEKRATEAATGLVCQRGEGRDDGYQYCELRQRPGRSPAATAVSYAVYVQRYLEHVESIKLERQAEFAATLGDAQLLQPVAAVDNSSSTAVVDSAAAAAGESAEGAVVAVREEEAVAVEMVAVVDAQMTDASAIAMQQYTETVTEEVTETVMVSVVEGEAVQEQQQQQQQQPNIEHVVDVAAAQREEQEAASPVRALDDCVTVSTSAATSTATSEKSPNMSVLAASPSLVPRRPLTPPKTCSPRRCTVVISRGSSESDSSYSKEESTAQGTAVEAVVGSAAAAEYSEDTDMDIEGSSSSGSASSDELNSSGSSSGSSAVVTEVSEAVTLRENSSEPDAAAVLLLADDMLQVDDSSNDDDEIDVQQQLAEAVAMADSTERQLLILSTTTSAASDTMSDDAIIGSVPAVAVAALEAEHAAAVAAAEAKLWAVWEAALQVHHTEVAAAEEALAAGMAQLQSAAAIATNANVPADSAVEVSSDGAEMTDAGAVLGTSSSASDSEVEAVAAVAEEEAAVVSSTAAVSEVDISMDLWDSEEINSSFAANASQQQQLQFDGITADDSVCLDAAESAVLLSTGTAHSTAFTAAAAEAPAAAAAVTGSGTASACELCCNGAACVILQPCEHELCARCVRKLQRHCEQSSGVLRCPWDRQPVTRLDATTAVVGGGIGSSAAAVSGGVQDSSTELDSSSASSSSSSL
jgi:hypothetical protein